MQSKDQRITNRLLEIYRRSQYRTTLSGDKVRWDEPGEEDTPEVQRHNDALTRSHQNKAASKDRLKSKSAVPTRKGKPIFEDSEVLNENLQQVLSTFRQLYQSNRATNFRTWAKVVAKVLEDLD